jgi:hypothetical protein
MSSTVSMISALTLCGMPEFIHSDISAREASKKPAPNQTFAARATKVG